MRALAALLVPALVPACALSSVRDRAAVRPIAEHVRWTSRRLV